MHAEEIPRTHAYTGIYNGTGGPSCGSDSNCNRNSDNDLIFNSEHESESDYSSGSDSKENTKMHVCTEQMTVCVSMIVHVCLIAWEYHLFQSVIVLVRVITVVRVTVRIIAPI